VKACLLMFTLLLSSLALPQSQPPSKAASEAAAVPADVQTIDNIVAALYQVISGPAGQARDWGKFRSLFWPGARLMPLGPAKETGMHAARVLSVEDYITRTDPFFAKEGFYEAAVANRIDRWADIAQVFSTYESRHATTEKPFARGINSIQLVYDGRRWWVLSILWEGESPQNPLPPRMLKAPLRKR
jgi:hypothetical protein